MKRIVPLLVLAACSRFGNSDERAHHERIVCLSKQYNEILFALGATDDLVAVDLSSTYPPEIKKLPTVGYHRALSVEAIAATKPTLVLHDDNIGPEHVVRQLVELSIPMKVFAPKGVDLPTTEALITEMGRHFKKEAEARRVNEKLERDMKAALGRTYADKPKVLVIHFGRANNVYLTMTGASTAGKMIEWAGGAIPVAGTQGMLPLSPEVIAAADPDVVLLTDFGYDRLGGALDQIAALPGLGQTRAIQQKRVFRVEEHDLVYIGPRTGENVLKLADLIHGHP
jgi:iron complex transport system substrate-binding protein